MIAIKEHSAKEASEPSEQMTKPAMLFIAGFGDNAGMFDRLHHTKLADLYDLLPVNLPGFGAPSMHGPTTLKSLSKYIAEVARENAAEFIVAHSVASIVASLAAKEADCPITTIISLEGNITKDDAYFSGTAADYNDSESFFSAFLDRLNEMAVSKPIIARYRDSVSRADPVALWQLGSDARRFSTAHVPGEVLVASASKIIYIYNSENCPESTLEWLRENTIRKIEIANASHWISVDQPELLATKIEEELA